MMQIYLTHPRHGKKIASMEKEAEADKKAGWVEVTKEEYFGPPPKAPTPEKSLSDQYEEKFGKRPHHRMNAESIEKALHDSAEA